MDSGDHSGNRLTASDARFSETRSNSFSNLFQGFFGVRPASTSVCDIPSLESTKASEEISAWPVVSPSNDDSWILSHLLLRKHEKEDDGNLRRNVTWSEFGKFEHLQSGKSSSAASLTSDASRRIVDEPTHRADTPGFPLAEESASLADDRIEEFDQPKTFVAKNMEHPNYSNAIMLSFLMHDVFDGALMPREDGSSLEQTGSMDHHGNKSSMPAASSSGPNTDLVDHSCLPLVVTSSERLPGSKHTLRDLLWNFNHEKINVSKKEMNLIASIDQ